MSDANNRNAEGLNSSRASFYHCNRDASTEAQRRAVTSSLKNTLKFGGARCMLQARKLKLSELITSTGDSA